MSHIVIWCSVAGIVGECSFYFIIILERIKIILGYTYMTIMSYFLQLVRTSSSSGLYCVEGSRFETRPVPFTVFCKSYLSYSGNYFAFFPHNYARGILLKRFKDETAQTVRGNVCVAPGNRTRHPLLVRRKRQRCATRTTIMNSPLHKHFPFGDGQHREKSLPPSKYSNTNCIIT